MNDSKLTPVLAALTVLAGMAIGANGPAQAVPDLAGKALTKAKVVAIARSEATRVLDSRSSTLHVASADTAVAATSADTARSALTAGSADVAKVADRAKVADLAADASALGGKAPGDYVSTAGLVGSSGISPSCNPTSTAYILCTSLALPLTRPSRLLVVSQVPVGADSSSGATGSCRLVLDGQLVREVDVAAGGTDGGFTYIPPAAYNYAQIVQQQCREESGDLRLENTSLSVLAFPVAP